MFKNILKNLYFYKMNLLFEIGIMNKKIIEFNDEFYEKLNNTYINTLPVSIHIKYLKPQTPPGKCYDRSLYMFFCFDDAILVRGNHKDLELLHGKPNAGHGWIEIDNYVYDPSLLMRFDKDIYYQLYKPTNVCKYTKKDYCSIEECAQLYNNIKATTVDDFKPNGKKRYQLSTTIPLIETIAHQLNDEELINDLTQYLNLIDYNPNKKDNNFQKKLVN